MDFKRLDNIQSFGGSTAWLFIFVSAPTFSYPAPSSEIRTNCWVGGHGGSRFGVKGGVGPPFVRIRFLVLCRRARLSEGHTCVCARNPRQPLPTARPASRAWASAHGLLHRGPPTGVSESGQHLFVVSGTSSLPFPRGKGHTLLPSKDALR